MTASGFCENIIHCSLHALLSQNMLEAVMYNGSSIGNVAIVGHEHGMPRITIVRKQNTITERIVDSCT